MVANEHTYIVITLNASHVLFTQPQGPGRTIPRLIKPNYAYLVCFIFAVSIGFLMTLTYCSNRHVKALWWHWLSRSQDICGCIGDRDK